MRVAPVVTRSIGRPDWAESIESLLPEATIKKEELLALLLDRHHGVGCHSLFADAEE